MQMNIEEVAADKFHFKQGDRIAPHYNEEESKRLVLDPSLVLMVISRTYDFDRKDYYYGVNRHGNHEVFAADVLHTHYYKIP